jgi:hypothetical protein
MRCIHGSPECVPFNLLEAQLSDFHNQDLSEATRKIKQIVAEIPEHPAGHKLSLLIIRKGSKRGVLLAWVNHGEEVPDGAQNVVTGKDSPEVIARALGLQD